MKGLLPASLFLLFSVFSLSAQNKLSFSSIKVNAPTNSVFKGQQSAVLAQIDVKVSGSTDSVILSKLYFTLKGTTARADITKILLYSTGNKDFSGLPLNLTDTISTISKIPVSRFIFSTHIKLHTGDNYFSLAYDVANDATTGDYIGASIDSLIIADTARNIAANTRRPMTDFGTYCPVKVLFPNKINFYYVGLTYVKLGNAIENKSADLDTLTFYSLQALNTHHQDIIPVQIKCGQGYPEQVRAWVDWNNDGYFAPGEMAFSRDTLQPSGVLKTYLTVPCNATTGVHRIRITSDYLYAAKLSPCSNLYYGDAEEYLINVQADQPSVASYKAQEPYYLGTPIVLKNTSTGTGTMHFDWEYGNNDIYNDTSISPVWRYYSAGWKKAKLRMTLKTCDSTVVRYYTDSFFVEEPADAPVTDFLTEKNTVEKNQAVRLLDISSNGPNQWQWTISPAVREGKNLFTWLNNSNSESQNPVVSFSDTGTYTLSLTTWNDKGKGTTETKKYYLTVMDADSLCHGSDTIRTLKGMLYDDGGKSAAYSSNENCFLVISPPCADAIHLTFSSFDASIFNTNPNGRGGDYLRVYDGINNKGKPLHDSAGFSYGLQNNYPDNSAVSIPELVAHSGNMYLEWHSDGQFNGEGFVAKWVSDLMKVPKPKASISGPDKAYKYQTVSFREAATGSGVQYFWDFDGDNKTDAVGAIAQYSFSTAESYRIRLIAQNCGGADTVYKNIDINVPSSAPVVNFTSSATRIAVDDIITLTDQSTQGPYKWEWTITRTDGATSYQYYNSSASSQSPSLFFRDTGWYNITLDATNEYGTSYRTRARYIYVFKYCQPNVSKPSADLAISRVSIKNSSGSEIFGYSGDSGQTFLHPKTTEVPYLAYDGSFLIHISRSSSFNSMNGKIWIDFNGDGDFLDASEEVYNATSITDTFWETRVRIPSTSAAGTTRIRIGTDLSSYIVNPCGPSQAGSYRDFTIYIGKDTVPPVIFLKDKDTVSVEEGSLYLDPGYTAIDDIDGDISGSVKTASFIRPQPGYYPVYFNVKDKAGNSALTVKRIVHVIADTTKPIVILNGPQLLYREVNTNLNDPGVTIADNIGAGLKVKDSGVVDSSRIGHYTRYYIGTDARGNKTIKTRNFVIGDTTSPVLALNGARIVSLQVLHHFTDPGVEVSDNYSHNIPVHVHGSVDSSIIGTYRLVYTATDSAGNGPVQIVRYVVVFDTIAPVLNMSQDTIFWDVRHPFTYPDYTVTDDYWKGYHLTLHEVGFVNVYRIGTYKAVFYATDGSSNKSNSITVYVKVVDRIPPVVMVLGAATVHVPRWGHYLDPGVEYYDNYDPKPFYHEEGTFKNTQEPGLFYKIYWAEDHSGNRSEYAYRFIYVDEADGATGIKTDSLSGFTFYPNPANDRLNIGAVSFSGDALITVNDMEGRLLIRSQAFLSSTGTYSLPVGKLSAGMYILHISGPTAVFSKPFIICR
jgi:PKD repeat protein